jgi:cytidylate kinase
MTPRSARQPLVIAVDGPAASGKGTIARALAKHFGLPHMDTGMLYRAVALNLSASAATRAASSRRCAPATSLAQVDPRRSRAEERFVGSIASAASRPIPAVRAALLERQRDFAGQPAARCSTGATSAR